jgi:hypothetical protein
MDGPLVLAITQAWREGGGGRANARLLSGAGLGLGVSHGEARRERHVARRETSGLGVVTAGDDGAGLGERDVESGARAAGKGEGRAAAADLSR